MRATRSVICSLLRPVLEYTGRLNFRLTVLVSSIIQEVEPSSHMPTRTTRQLTIATTNSGQAS